MCPIEKLLVGFALLLYISITDGTKNEQVDKVHMIMMNHLDVGYNGIPSTGYINNVLNKYFTEYFPRAVNLSKEFGESNGPNGTENFLYTTHPWLLSLYFDCPPNMMLSGVKLICPSLKEKQELQDVIYKGDVTWHAGPMNMQPELMSVLLFEFGLRLSHDLDKMFHIDRKGRVLSQRDVPGMTRTVIPILKKHNIVGISVGVNPMTAPPAVPKIFRWQYKNDDILATWNAGGYPEVPGPSPAHPGGLSKDNCVVIPGFNEALCFAFRTDNGGPPSGAKEINLYYKILQAEFPGATVKASRLEDFMLAVRNSPIYEALPVIAEEIGDTWIQGVSSDPRKIAEYKAVVREIDKCLSSDLCNYNDSRIYNASRLLLKLPEHTWGLPAVHDAINWKNEDFYKVKGTGDFVACENSWFEQRMFVTYVLEALGNHPVVTKVQQALIDLEATVPDPTKQGYHKVTSSDVFMCPLQEHTDAFVNVAYSTNGSILQLDYHNGQTVPTKFASVVDNLGEFVYTTYNESDFTTLSKHYDYNGMSAGFRKTNSSLYAHPESKTWDVIMTHLYQKDDRSCEFWQRRELVDQTGWTYYGAPKAIWVHIKFNNKHKIDNQVYFQKHQHSEKAAFSLDLTFVIQQKTSTRLPEAMSVKFQPKLQSNNDDTWMMSKHDDTWMMPKHDTWMMSKLGGEVDMLNVRLNGSQMQHAVDSAVCRCDRRAVSITPLDTPLMCPYTTHHPGTVFPTQLQPLRLPIQGIMYNIYNNIWDTNYVLWYPYQEDDQTFKARYHVSLELY